MSDRVEIHQREPVELSADFLAQIEDIEDVVDYRRGFTAVQDEALLRFWTVKNKYKLAEVIGYSYNTCRKRYRHLMEGK